MSGLLMIFMIFLFLMVFLPAMMYLLPVFHHLAGFRTGEQLSTPSADRNGQRHGRKWPNILLLQVVQPRAGRCHEPEPRN